MFKSAILASVVSLAAVAVEIDVDASVGSSSSGRRRRCHYKPRRQNVVVLGRGGYGHHGYGPHHGYGGYGRGPNVTVIGGGYHGGYGG